MQRDFHFYGVAVLARAAGFQPSEALTIAYASQYVDDSTESELVRIRAAGNELRFDPVRTAHKGLRLLGSLEWSAQKRVYVPFHFLPPRRFDPPNAAQFTFVTEKGAKFGEELLQAAFLEPTLNRRLCRIGIALHTYADMWSHHGFSGRQSRVENDVENIRLLNPVTNRYGHPIMENVLFDAFPQIGHAEAGFHPDLACENWKYDSRRRKNVRRDNTKEFLEAAKRIHDILVTLRGKPPFTTWGSLRSAFQRLLRLKPSQGPGFGASVTFGGYMAYHDRHLKERCEEWQKQFKSWFPGRKYEYSRTAWRDAALKGDTNWDEWTAREWDRMEPLAQRKGFWDSLWTHFHRAALRQRHFVLESLP